MAPGNSRTRVGHTRPARKDEARSDQSALVATALNPIRSKHLQDADLKETCRLKRPSDRIHSGLIEDSCRAGLSRVMAFTRLIIAARRLPRHSLEFRPCCNPFELRLANDWRSGNGDRPCQMHDVELLEYAFLMAFQKRANLSRIYLDLDPHQRGQSGLHGQAHGRIATGFENRHLTFIEASMLMRYCFQRSSSHQVRDTAGVIGSEDQQRDARTGVE